MQTIERRLTKFPDIIEFYETITHVFFSLDHEIVLNLFLIYDYMDDEEISRRTYFDINEVRVILTGLNNKYILDKVLKAKTLEDGTTKQVDFFYINVHFTVNSWSAMLYKMGDSIHNNTKKPKTDTLYKCSNETSCGKLFDISDLVTLAKNGGPSLPCDNCDAPVKELQSTDQESLDNLKLFNNIADPIRAIISKIVKLPNLPHYLFEPDFNRDYEYGQEDENPQEQNVKPSIEINLIHENVTNKADTNDMETEEDFEPMIVEEDDEDGYPFWLRDPDDKQIETHVMEDIFAAVSVSEGLNEEQKREFEDLLIRIEYGDEYSKKAFYSDNADRPRYVPPRESFYHGIVDGKEYDMRELLAGNDSSVWTDAQMKFVIERSELINKVTRD